MSVVTIWRVGSRISRVFPFCFELRTHTRASPLRAHLLCSLLVSITIKLHRPGSPINIIFFSVEAPIQVHFNVTWVSLSVHLFTVSGSERTRQLRAFVPPPFATINIFPSGTCVAQEVRASSSKRTPSI